MTTIEEIRAFIANAKTENKTLATLAGQAAPQGQAMPYRQHAQAVAASDTAGKALNAMMTAGMKPASVSVGKKSGNVSFTFRPLLTLEQRLAKYAQTMARRKAACEAKRAAKAAKAAANVAPIAKTDAISAALATLQSAGLLKAA